LYVDSLKLLFMLKVHPFIRNEQIVQKYLILSSKKLIFFILRIVRLLNSNWIMIRLSLTSCLL